MPNSSRVARTILLAALAWPGAASAQETLEGRLRAALQQTNQTLRTLQDQSDAQAAELVRAKAEVETQMQRNKELEMQLEAARGAPAAPPASPSSEAELASAKAELAAAMSRIGALRGQAASAEAALRARAAEAQAQAQASAKTLASTQGLVRACHATNRKLEGVATTILDTYKSQSFRSVWLRSYEPLLGLDKVELQNIVQDFEDKIREQRLPAAP